MTGTISHKVPASEDDPFAALGIRAGSFILYPSLTTSYEHATNASGNGRSDTLTVTPELRLQSDWALHAATLTLRGSYAREFTSDTPDSPSGSADATGRIDLKPGWDIGLAGNYSYAQQSISDPNFPAGVDNRPGVHDFSGSAALNGRFGRKVFTAEGKVGRSIYENGTSSGAVVDQGYRNNTTFGGRLRLGYELPLGVTPFVEGEVSRRHYDQTTDNNGLRRSKPGDGRPGRHRLRSRAGAHRRDGARLRLPVVRRSGAGARSARSPSTVRWSGRRPGSTRPPSAPRPHSMRAPTLPRRGPSPIPVRWTWPMPGSPT